MRKQQKDIEDPYPKLQGDLRALGFRLGCEEMRGLRGPSHAKSKIEHRRMLNKLYSLTKAS
jgi:hypothetical protein